MARKVTQKTKDIMNVMRDKGKTYAEISKSLGLSQSTVTYHLNEDYRKKSIERSMKNNNKNWSGLKKYSREYRKNRYHNDEEFADRLRKHSREYWRRKNGTTKI